MDWIYHIEQIDLETENTVIVGIATDIDKAKAMKKYLLQLNNTHYDYQIKQLRVNCLSIDHKFIKF